MFPILYHIHHQNHMEDLPFWQRLVSQAPGAILELGCGTGRILLNLELQQQRVYGIDRDHAVLRYFQNQLAGATINRVELIQADMTEFHLALKFGLIFIGCNTLSTLTRTQRQAVYGRVAYHLHPKGLFAASIPNPYVLADLPSSSEAEIEEVLTLPFTEDPVQVSSAWKRRGKHITFYWYYDRLFSDGRVERFEAQAVHYIHPKKDYLNELRQAGFNNFSIFGDFDQSPYLRSSPYLIIVGTCSHPRS